MNNGELEEAVKVLEDFKNNVMARDKLEWNVGRGGYKIRRDI